MVDLLWWLHARPWEVMFYVGMIAGIGFFISEMLDLLQGWNVRLARGIVVIRAELTLEKQRRKDFYKRYSNRQH
jgi:hypothetical protein